MKPFETSPRPGTATRTTVTRRRPLNTLAASGVAVVGGGALVASHDPIPADAAVPYAGGAVDASEETLSGLNPTRALHELLSGNTRYVAAHMLHPRQGVDGAPRASSALPAAVGGDSELRGFTRAPRACL